MDDIDEMDECKKRTTEKKSSKVKKKEK